MVFEGELDDGNKAEADLGSTVGDGIVSRAMKICKIFCRFRKARQETDMNVLRNVLQLLSRFMEESISARTEVTTPNSNRLKVQRHALREANGRF